MEEYSTIYRAFVKWLKINKLWVGFKQDYIKVKWYYFCHRKDMFLDWNGVLSYHNLRTVKSMEDLSMMVNQVCTGVFNLNVVGMFPYRDYYFRLGEFQEWFKANHKYYYKKFSKELKKSRRAEKRRAKDDNRNERPFYDRIGKKNRYKTW